MASDTCRLVIRSETRPTRNSSINGSLVSCLTQPITVSCLDEAGKALLSAGTRIGRACPHSSRSVHVPRGPTLAVVARPAATAKRALSFSFPGPRKLGDITNLPLLEKVANYPLPMSVAAVVVVIVMY